MRLGIALQNHEILVAMHPQADEWLADVRGRLQGGIPQGCVSGAECVAGVLWRVTVGPCHGVTVLSLVLVPAWTSLAPRGLGNTPVPSL